MLRGGLIEGRVFANGIYAGPRAIKFYIIITHAIREIFNGPAALWRSRRDLPFWAD